MSDDLTDIETEMPYSVAWRTADLVSSYLHTADQLINRIFYGDDATSRAVEQKLVSFLRNIRGTSDIPSAARQGVVLEVSQYIQNSANDEMRACSHFLEAALESLKAEQEDAPPEENAAFLAGVHEDYAADIAEYRTGIATALRLIRSVRIHTPA
jgi:hypothetical protein